MKRFKIEHKNYDQPVTYITLYNPPYEDENVLSRTKFNIKDVTITEMKQYQEEE